MPFSTRASVAAGRRLARALAIAAGFGLALGASLLTPAQADVGVAGFVTVGGGHGHGRGHYGHRGYGHRGYGHRGYGHRGYGHRGYGHRGYGHRGYGHYRGSRGYRGYGYPGGYFSLHGHNSGYGFALSLPLAAITAPAYVYRAPPRYVEEHRYIEVPVERRVLAPAPEDCVQTREYQTRVIIDGREVEAYGTACLKPDGSWERQGLSLAR